VANDSEFQEQMKRLGKLVEEFDRLPESAAKVTGKELVQILMDVHGAALESVMDIVFESGEAGSALIHKLGQDSVVGSLLLLYSLHPDDLQTRVMRALERMRPRLRKLATAVELMRADEGEKGYVQLRLATSGHNCGSSARDLRTIVEDCLYEFAPDVTTLEILGLEEPVPNGFVALESLLGHSLAAVDANLPNGHQEQRPRHE
jgi:Fe-S cluster biogenesis protein NfuA